MCRDGYRNKCQRCGVEITCRDDYPNCEWGCEPKPRAHPNTMIGRQ